MSWNDFHRRGEILREVIAVADRRADGHLPTDVPGVADAFADDLDLIAALVLKWHARLSGNLERALALDPLDRDEAVARSWSRTAADMPGVRAIVDRTLAETPDEPTRAALMRARDRERARLAAAAGRASDLGADAVLAGERIERRARTITPGPALRVPAPLASRCAETASLVERIRAALAA